MSTRRGSRASWAAPDRNARGHGVRPLSTLVAVEIVLALLIVAIIAWFVSAPLRRSEDATAPERAEDRVIAELEGRKEAKYREIRDAELDREQGKLSQADWGRQDADLRREAIEILKALDRAQAGGARARSGH
jgi:flagellar biosynthesis/type III secretory pathway M-ring protein FliF/YscJ